MTKSVTVTCLAALAACAASPATATVTFSDVLIETRSTFQGFTTIEDVDTSTVAPDDPQIFTTLVEPLGLARFPTSPSALPAGFASATFTALMIGGVGISGIALNRFNTEAFALYEQTLYNDSDEPVFLTVDYTIPNMEAAVFAGPLILQGPEATARAALEVTACNADLSDCVDEDVFLYLLTADKVSTGVDFIRSPDLVIDAGSGSPYADGDVNGLRYGAFSGSAPLYIPAGGLLDIRYSFTAFGRTSTPETGYQAFIGDPFDITSSGGPLQFRLAAPPAPILEPSAWAMLITGLAALAFTARRRRPSF
ncbi:MAG: hypothetical protein AB7H90_12800 [Alphaproteobacteria bacterium]